MGDPNLKVGYISGMCKFLFTRQTFLTRKKKKIPILRFNSFMASSPASRHCPPCRVVPTTIESVGPSPWPLTRVSCNHGSCPHSTIHMRKAVTPVIVPNAPSTHKSCTRSSHKNHHHNLNYHLPMQVLGPSHHPHRFCSAPLSTDPTLFAPRCLASG